MAEVGASIRLLLLIILSRSLTGAGPNTIDVDWVPYPGRVSVPAASTRPMKRRLRQESPEAAAKVPRGKGQASPRPQPSTVREICLMRSSNIFFPCAMIVSMIFPNWCCS